LVFKAEKAKEEMSKKVTFSADWKNALSTPDRVAEYIDTSFPAALNVSLCLHAHAIRELAKPTPKKDGIDDKNPIPEMPVDIVEAVGSAADAQRAYVAACRWWTKSLDSHYGGGLLDSDEPIDGAETEEDFMKNLDLTDSNLKSSTAS